MKISPENFRKSDGTIDHQAFLDAVLDPNRGLDEIEFEGDDIVKSQIEIGEACKTCLIDLQKPAGKPTNCQSCSHIDDESEIVHPSKIRCPRCKNLSETSDANLVDNGMLCESMHRFTCQKCSTTFEVERIEAYISPPLTTK
jgi:hypothetical protein